MTAINIIIQRRRGVVTIGCDGAAYDDEGIIRMVHRKCKVIGNHTALANTGPAGLSELLALKLANVASFDAFLEMAETEIPRLCNELLSDLSDGNDGTGELYLAGFSKKRSRPEAYSLAFCRAGMSDKYDRLAARAGQPITAYKLRSVGPFGGTPNITKPEFDAARWTPLSVEQLENVDVKKTLLHLLNIQRRRLDPCFAGKSVVGGHAQIVTIGAAGVLFDEIVHKWNDPLGWRIEPEPIDWAEFGSAPQAAAVIPMNRQQRRAAMRERAKQSSSIAAM